MTTEMYQTVYSAWVEGRLENVLQRQKELAALHAALKTHRLTLVQSLCQGDSNEASAVQEVNLALDTVKQLYDQLDFPQSLAQEKAIKAGRSVASNQVPLGPTFIQASSFCPLSSMILPLAAAVAAGSACILLPSEQTPSVNDKLREVIRTSLDQGAIAIAPNGSSSTTAELTAMRFEVAVLQNATTQEEMSISLRAVNPTIRIHYPSSGLPAIFVSRSTPDLAAVATIINDTVLQDGQNYPSRLPRLCFVDEFLIEKLSQLVLHAASSPASAHPSQRLAELLAQTFPSLINKSLHSSVLVLSSNDAITADTISRIAHQVTSQFRGIVFVPTRSLDHGIDLWNKVNRGSSAQATYVFGDSQEASYYARFLRSDHVFINQIPLRSLVMIPPASITNNYSLPYSKEDFSTNKAILQVPLGFQETQRKFTDALQLNRIAQPMGGRLSYFEQGLIVGLAVSLVAASGLAYLGYLGYRLL